MVVETALLRWIIALPALGVLFHLFAGQRTPRAVALVGPGVVGAAFAVAAAAALRLWALPEGGALHDQVYTWMELGPARVMVALRLDALSAVMVLVVTGVGFLIHVYSVGYMHDDPDGPRYFAYLNLFTTAMLILVLADNLILLFVGWEGVGLCSYLLIGFWYEKTANAAAGRKAFIVNRIGDACFLLGLFVLVWTLGRGGVWSLEVSVIEQHLDLLRDATTGGWPVPLVVGLLLFAGATGKSAQIPLYVWLPDAMAGPTPVSALIHAATMVTAGVYMVARMHALYALAPAVLAVVAVIGALTCLLAAVIATAQMDIKKVLAYSTVSQLGYMFLALGVGVPAAAIFHLVTHAFFKALLFLGAGSVIHAMGGEQDMSRMGALRAHLPITFATMLIGALAIAGLPPLSGFFSKDEIIWGAFAGPLSAPLLGVIGLVVAFCTAYYMGRLMCLTFLGDSRVAEPVRRHLHESPAVMTLPLVVLAVLAAAGGFLPVPRVVEAVLGHEPMSHAPAVFMALTILLALAGFGLAWGLYVARPELPAVMAQRLGGLYGLVRDKFRVDELYEATVVRGVEASAEFGAREVDAQLIDGAVNRTGSLVAAMSTLWRRLQTGNLQHYALCFLAGALVLLAYYTA